ncbi:MAG: hypothetical protein A2V98_19790 [Planctomycetes bacterium RBG_16_64_12]|nr:MAG: hypothetical protein A2V98_19790 [Planctomycetes bacterium RBG_16_64_12]
MVISAEVALAAGNLPTPETRSLTADEAAKAIEHDWLFQAGDVPSVWRTRQEIQWTRQLAARLAGRPKPPDLSAELKELDEIERQLPDEATLAAQPPLRLPEGLVARWTFDEPGGNVIADASGGGWQGTLAGRTQTVPGIRGGSLALGGLGYMTTDPKLSAITQESYTVSTWLRTTASVMDILGSGVRSGDFLLVVNQGPVRGHHWTDSSGNVLDGKAVVNDGRWHHVAQVVDQTSLSIYVDGTLDVTAKLAGSKIPSADPINLGTRTPGDTAYRFRGALDEVCLFGRAFGPEELKTLYEEGRALADANGADQADVDLYLAVRRVKRRIMLKDPLVDFSQLLLVDVPCYDALNHESMHRVFPQAQNNVGRLLLVEGLDPGGRVRNLGPGPGMYWRPELSFDARKVLFCHRPAQDRTFHLYEMDLDGSNLRQLTFGSYDDLDPIYAPDGHILFLSNRGNSYARCAVGHPSYVLARCDASGKNLYIISASNEPEYTPAMLPNGRVLYTRWEYTDKELFRIQSLWSTNTDGTGTSAYWGNQSYWPDMLVEARPIPGTDRVIFSGQGHHDIVHGSIGIIDRSKGFNYPHGLTKVTVDAPWAEVGDGPEERPECDEYHPSGDYVGYRTPFPLSEEVFLVSARMPEQREGTLLGAARMPESRFALYLMDVYGNRELIYRGAYDVLYALPVRPRQKPPVIPDTVAWPGSEKEGREVKPGVVYSANVLEGLPDVVRQKAKYVRVINLDYTTFTFGLKTQAPGRWGEPAVTHMHAGPPLSITGNDGFKRVLGTVPIEADGSVAIEVPPAKQLHFQLLDDRYRAVHTMRSFTNVMPGERRGCVGCHEMHSTAPPLYAGIAMQKPPVRPTPPPWGSYYNLGYERDIQPILDRYCGSCHQGDGEARKDFDLTLRPSEDGGTFPEPYVTLTLGARRALASFPGDCEGGVAGTILPMAFPLTPASDRTLPPMTALSYKSRLVDLASSGEHYDVKVDELSLRKLIVWVDILCPYLGEEEILAMPDPDPNAPFFSDSPYPPRTPGIRPFADSPYPPRMKNAPIVNRAYCQDEFPTQADRLKSMATMARE